MYIDNRPVMIGGSTSAPGLGVYDAVPRRIGTWIDGNPVWRVAFENVQIPYLAERPNLYTGGSYTPFYDYTNRAMKYVNSFDDVLLLEGVMQLQVMSDTYIGSRDGQYNFSFDISHESGFIEHETMYISGYAEFVTPSCNVQ